MSMADGALHVSVVYSPQPRDVREWELELAAGSTVADALRATGVDPASLAVGVWGKEAPLSQALRERDRIEIYRPLKVDPKVARRERFRRQGARAAGLFARRKP
jgi:putative ubiquitin-RnfH superfamily antitoxin RatB of RatAB toxin-antitoxin module